MTKNKTYELTFYGAAMVARYSIPRHKRHHPTLEAARDEAARVHQSMEHRGLPADAHPAVIYGPDGEQYR